MDDDEVRNYVEQEGLDRLIDLSENADYQVGVFDTVSGDLQIPFPPDPSDLVRLHQLIRTRRSFTVLEFGLGYSTVVIADALRKNEQEWLALEDRPEIRNRFMFRCFAVDADESWIEMTKERFNPVLSPYVEFHHSGVTIGTFNDRICHYYDQLPDIVPDFIYLDGPMPKDAKGSVNGLTFNCDERTVMSGDLLMMEPTFLPGTFILVDGRTNNARFLERNFQRDYKVSWDREGDVTTFELDEDRLGPYNLLANDFL